MRKRSRIEAWAALVAALMIASSAPAAAQPPASSADELVQRGAQLYEAGKPQQAAAEWEKAIAQLGDAGWKIHYNLGLAYEAAGDATRAIENYDAFLRRVASEAAALPAELEERRSDAAARVRALKAAHGAFVFPPQPGEVSARIDDAPARRVGFTAYVMPGSHRIDIVGPKGAVRSRQLEIAGGASLRIDTTDPTPRAPVSPPRPVPPPPEPKTAADEPEFPLAVVLVGAGLTIASFAIPIGLWFVARDERNEATALGAGHTGYAEARDEFDSARTRYLATYAVPAGLGAITLGIAIWGFIHVSQGTTQPSAMLGVGGDF
jgi:tetratricopeptide (TPR) repeat protein